MGFGNATARVFLLALAMLDATPAELRPPGVELR